MGCDQSSDANARWRRTFASDFNAERPAKRNLQNNTYIMGTKFPTPQNYANQERQSQNSDKNQPVGQAIQMNVESTAVARQEETTTKKGSVAKEQQSLMIQGAAFMGVSDEKFRELRSITEEELSKHDKNNDCWIAIQGVVFDVTQFLHSHPGGFDAISNEGGRDASITFKKAHPSISKADDLTKEKLISIKGRLILSDRRRRRHLRNKRKEKKQEALKREHKEHLRKEHNKEAVHLKNASREKKERARSSNRRDDDDDSDDDHVAL